MRCASGGREFRLVHVQQRPIASDKYVYSDCYGLLVVPDVLFTSHTIRVIVWVYMRDLPKRHPHQRLTARAVQTARPRTSARRMADGGGLYLRVAPSGAKSWVLRTVVQGRRCDLGLGSVTLVSLAEAREQAVDSPEGRSGRR